MYKDCVQIIPKPLKVEMSEAATTFNVSKIVSTTQGADSSLGEEGYKLIVTPQAITIRAPQPAGLFYAHQTLDQLNDGKNQIPICHIEDAPRFSYRGLMLDSCRHMQSVQYIKLLL